MPYVDWRLKTLLEGGGRSRVLALVGVDDLIRKRALYLYQTDS